MQCDQFGAGEDEPDRKKKRSEMATADERVRCLIGLGFSIFHWSYWAYLTLCPLCPLCPPTKPYAQFPIQGDICPPKGAVSASKKKKKVPGKVRRLIGLGLGFSIFHRSNWAYLSLCPLNSKKQSRMPNVQYRAKSLARKKLYQQRRRRRRYLERSVV